MTISHRRWHLILWLIIGPLVLIGFALALGARRDIPTEPFQPQEQILGLENRAVGSREQNQP